MKKIFSVFSSAVIYAFLFSSCGVVYETSESAGTAETTEYTTEDLNNLKDFILTNETPDLSDRDYDLNNDDRWDSFDVSLMRKKLSESMTGNNNDILVTYFSCTGTTETVAEYIADYLYADTYQI